MTKWTDDEMHTAMCLWEAWISIDIEDTDDPTSMRAKQIIEANGTCTVRQMMADLVKDCDTAWEAARAIGYDEAFDWEFVPALLRQSIDSGRLDIGLQQWWGAA